MRKSLENVVRRYLESGQREELMIHLAIILKQFLHD